METTADGNETILTAADATADRTLRYQTKGTILTTASTITPTVNSLTIGSTSITLGYGFYNCRVKFYLQLQLYMQVLLMLLTQYHRSYWIVFEGSTADGYETTIKLWMQQQIEQLIS